MKAFACNFEMAQNSNCSVFLKFQLEISITCQNLELAHFFQLENSEMAQNSKRKWIRGKKGSNFEPSQSFRAEKSEPTQGFDT